MGPAWWHVEMHGACILYVHLMAPKGLWTTHVPGYMLLVKAQDAPAHTESSLQQLAALTARQVVCCLCDLWRQLVGLSALLDAPLKALACM